jgi:hypothetical protein
MSDLLVVLDDVADVVAPTVVGFAYGHRVVCEIDITILAEEARHTDGGCEGFYAIKIARRALY